ncbi:hypothetical protein B0H16DRAFT_1490291 [Mycena metata]|uniref:N-alpha-acetyltransferase 40 n=1 Tax=Mycena metata TaxID=1033252 RepID=A0AAD7KIH1_9AGAR|nr:hypothetical protein B0H16DRAFT_1490291 [Mycena metata]
MFNRLSRFILVYPTTDGQSLSAQRHGLGRTLMNHLAKIGKDFKLDKIMLTVFKANTQALRFYKNFGFKPDETSPEDADEEDYKILSKSCR